MKNTIIEKVQQAINEKYESAKHDYEAISSRPVMSTLVNASLLVSDNWLCGYLKSFYSSFNSNVVIGMDAEGLYFFSEHYLKGRMKEHLNFQIPVNVNEITHAMGKRDANYKICSFIAHKVLKPLSEEAGKDPSFYTEMFNG